MNISFNPDKKHTLQLSQAAMTNLTNTVMPEEVYSQILLDPSAWPADSPPPVQTAYDVRGTSDMTYGTNIETALPNDISISWSSAMDAGSNDFVGHSNFDALYGQSPPLETTPEDGIPVNEIWAANVESGPIYEIEVAPDGTVTEISSITDGVESDVSLKSELAIDLIAFMDREIVSRHTQAGEDAAQ